MLDDSLLAELTGPQRRAVLHTDGPLLVLAGAGSGKTRVITRRAAHIARTVARPEQVLAITFTNKAAGEMRERMYALGVGRGMCVCTFHSLCARLLREYGPLAGIEPGFSIFDDADSRALVREAIEACDLSADNWQPRAVLSRISDAKARLLSPEAWAAEAHDFESKVYARIYAEYQRMIGERNACDFDDLLMHVARLLAEQEAVRAELADRFRYLLIDEYQDTNHAQYLIATRLAEARRNICATGDPDQSIYAWRGADIRNILDFEEEYPDATVVRLEQNFRSTGAILSAASTVIRNNIHRKHKDLWTEGERGGRVGVWTCEDETSEAREIGARIQQHCDSGGRPGDVAIFYRVNALSRVLEDALRKAKIPYQIARGVEFYARKEIKDVLAYVRAVVNPADETALLRALGTPARGIGKVTIERLKTHARRRGITLSAAITEAEHIEGLRAAGKKLEPFARLLDGLRAMPRSPVQNLVDAVVKRSGLEKALLDAGTVDNEPLQNVFELVTAAHQYDQEYPEGSVEEWLHQISLVSDVDAIDASGGAVTLMTLHAAKGLEFERVFIVGLEDGLLPHRRRPREKREEIEEERRLCFVGMTRAKRELTLTHALYRMVRGITERTVASRFLSELPGEEIEHRVIEEELDRSRSHLGRMNEQTLMVSDGMYYRGQRVRHDDYGEGSVIGLEKRGKSTFIRIKFDENGPRAFALEHVPLYILE